MKKYLFLVYLSLASMTCGQRTELIDFVPFGFGGLETMPVNDAVDLLMRLGYKGIIPQGREPVDLTRFEEFLDRSELEGDAFRIPAYYVNHRTYLSEGYDDSVQRAVIDILAAHGGGTIWMAVRAAQRQGDPVDFQKVNDFIKGVFEYATGVDELGNYRNVNVVFYPHDNNAYESTIEALPLVEEINDPRFTVSINLVHEYHAGRSDAASLLDTFNQAKGRIGAVILCGIRTNTFAIMSLEDSQHDLKPFMALVRDSEYTGPIGFINFGIPEDLNDGVDYPEEYLAGSIVEWESLSQSVGLFEKPVSPFAISPAFSGGDLTLHWNSKTGKFYHLMSSTNLVNWQPYTDGTNRYVNIPTSGIGTNQLPHLSLQGNQRFFKLEEDVQPSR